MANVGGFRGNGITLYIAGDTRGLDKALKQATNDVNTFVRKSKKAGKEAEAAQAGLFGGSGFRGSKINQGLRGALSPFGGTSLLFGSGAFVGAAAATTALSTAISAASNLNEQITKSQQVFGAASKSVIDWSKDTASSMGIARESAIEAAGTFGNLFKAQGFGDIQNSKLSKSLVQLASDLASFNNIDVNQVLQDLSSGLVGEIEPVRKYGADLRIARVQLEALAETGKKTVKQLSQQDLTLARLHLLYQDTAAAQGDFQRTSGGLANQQRKLLAQLNDLAANLGTLLLPAVTEIVKGLNDLIGVSNQAASALGKLADVKIPSLHIPISFDIPGVSVPGSGLFGGLGKTIKNVLKARLAVSEFGIPGIGQILAAKQIGDIVKSYKDETDKQTPRIAQQTAVVFSDFLDNVLTKASTQIHPKVSIGDLLQNVLATQVTLPGPKPIGPQTRAQNAQIIAQAQGDLNTLLKLQTQERDRLAKALAGSHGNVKQRAALSRALAQATAAVIATSKQIAENNKAQAGAAKEAAKQGKLDTFGKILSNLELGVSKAELTKQLGDDLNALLALKAGLEKQIKAGVDVTNAQSQLVTVIGQIADKRNDIAQAAKDAQQAKLFKQIGLSATGGEIIPGVANLKKQFDQLSSQDLSGVSKKLTNRLAGVGKALTNPILKSLPEVRDAIRQLFSAIRDELNKQSIGGKNEIKALNTNKIVKGLGLDPASVKALRQRLSKFTAGGQALAGTGVAAIAGGVPVVGGVPQVFVDVSLDGEKIAKNTTIRQGKRARKNPPQKRGPQAGRI